MQRTRTWLGALLLAGVVANHVRGSADHGVDLNHDRPLLALFSGAFVAPFLKAGITLACLLVVALALTLTQPAGARATAARATLTPVLEALGIFLVPLFVVGLLLTPLYLLRANDDATSHIDPASSMSGGTAAIVLGLFVLLLVIGPVTYVGALRALYLSLQNTFRARDAHPLLPAVVGLAVAAASALESAHEATQAGDPLSNQLSLLGVGGAAVVATLAVYEIRRLHADGVRWSSSPVLLPPHPYPSPYRGGPYPGLNWPPSPGPYGPGFPPAPHGQRSRSRPVVGLAVVTFVVLPIGVSVVAAAKKDSPAVASAPVGTYELNARVATFQHVPARLTAAHLSVNAMRLDLTFTNTTATPITALTCARKRQTPVLAYGPGKAAPILRATDDYCRRHPGQALRVPAHRRAVMWVQFTRPADLPGAVVLRWPLSGRTWAVPLTLPAAS